MGVTNYERKVELLAEIDELIGYKRRYKAEHSLESFIDIYLHHLATNRRPLFHKEILGKIQRIGLTGYAQDKRGQRPQGVPPLKDSLITPPNFSDKKTNPNFFSENFTENFTKQLFIAPRGFAKSTLCSRFFPLWLACYGKKKDILLISATASIAKENLRIIRNELEGNDKLIKDFGDMRSDKWTEEELRLNNQVIIRAKGQGFQIRGFRPDVIVCDDLEDESVIYSKEQRDKLEVWFFRTLLPTLKPDQHLVYIGTKLHQFALIAKLQEKEEFQAHLYKALVNGKSIWEDAWPVEELLKRKKESLYAFEAEYQNNPISLEEQPVKIHHLEGVVAKGKVVESCMSIDPAISEKDSSDFRAIQIMGKTEQGEFRELLTIKGRWGLDEMIDKIISTYQNNVKQHNILRILVEEVAFQKVVRTLLIKKSRDLGLYLPISTAELGVGANKRPKDKFQRLMQIVHLFENRVVEIRNTELFQELLAFPFGDYDDMVDVTVFNLYWLLNNRPGRYMVKQEKYKLPVKTTESFYVDEVRPGVYMARFGDKPKLEIRNNFINYDK